MLKPNEVNPETPVEAMAELLELGDPGPWPEGWSGWENTRKAHLQLLDKFKTRIPSYPAGKYQGRGIVTCISAKSGMSSGKFLKHGHMPSGWVLIQELRRLGCKLPITVGYLGDLEMDTAIKNLLKPYDVTCIDLRQYERQSPSWRILAGWESKIAAILASPYEEVLFLDSDNVPVIDPTFLFDTPEYQGSGAVLWPDVPPHDRKEWLPKEVWHNLGLAALNVVDAESGQLLYHKQRRWKDLQFTRWLNEHSDYVYKFVFGDKSTFLLGCYLAGNPPYMIPAGAGWNGAALLQHAPPSHGSRLLFEHCVRNKPTLDGYPVQGCLSNPGEIAFHLEQLRHLWDGRIWQADDPDSLSDKTKALIGKRFKYSRFLPSGPAVREIRLLEDNRIGRGADKCEFGWSLIEDEGGDILSIHHIEKKPTMLLRCDSSGTWHGEWLEYEKCKVTLEPIE